MRLRARYVQACLLVGVTVACAWLALKPFALVAYLSELVKDQLIRSQNLEPDSRVVFVEINEMALNELGQWPWLRSRWVEVLDVLRDAAVIGVDVLFVDKSSVPGEDEQLAEKLMQMPQVILAFALSSRQLRGLSLSERENLEDYSALTHLMLEEKPFAVAPALQLPNEELLAAGNSVGAIWVGKEGTRVRRYPLAVKFEDMFLPSFGLQMLQFEQGKPAMPMQGVTMGLSVGDRVIPYDRAGNVRLNFHEPSRYATVALADLLTGRVSPEVLTGKLVVLGASIIGGGAYDIVESPVGTLPGPLVHSTFLSNALQSHFLQESVSHTLWILAFLCTIALVLNVRPAIPIRLGCYVVVSAALVAFCFWAIHRHLVLLDGFVLMSAWLLLAITLETGFLTLSEQRLRRIDSGLLVGGNAHASPLQSREFSDRLLLSVQWQTGLAGAGSPQVLGAELNVLHQRVFDVVSIYGFQIAQVVPGGCIALSAEPAKSYDKRDRLVGLAEMLNGLFDMTRVEQGPLDVLPGCHPRHVSVVLCVGSCAILNTGPAGGKCTGLGGDGLDTLAALHCVAQLLRGSVVMCDIHAGKLLQLVATVRQLPLDSALLAALSLSAVYEWLPSGARGQLLAQVNTGDPQHVSRNDLLKVFAQRYQDVTARAILDGKLNEG